MGNLFLKLLTIRDLLCIDLYKRFMALFSNIELDLIKLIK